MTTCIYLEEKTHYNSKNRTSGLNYAKRNTKLFYKKGCVCRNGRNGKKHVHAACFFCSNPTIIVRGVMHNAHIFLFQCPLPSSCNDSYFIAAFSTLFSSLPVPIQSVSIHAICCMCIHSCQMFGLYKYVHYTLPMYISTSKTACVLGSFLASSPGSAHE